MRLSTLSLVTAALLSAAVSLGAAGAGGGAPAPGAAPAGPGGPGAPGGAPGRGAGRGFGGGAPAGPATPVPDGDKSKLIDVIDFGTTTDGAVNKLFILRNHKGNALKVMTYGATMQAI